MIARGGRIEAVPLRKFTVAFDLDLYAVSPGEAYRVALEKVREVVEKHQELRIDRIVAGELPTGGMEGAPHKGALNGWRLVYTIDEDRS